MLSEKNYKKKFKNVKNWTRYVVVGVFLIVVGVFSFPVGVGVFLTPDVEIF